MKVILTHDVKKVGKKDDIVNVSDGYATNYLIKNKYAVIYTKTSKEVLDKEKNERNIKNQEQIASFRQIKDNLEGKVLNFKVKTGAQDKVFGKISTKQIADELKKEGYSIDKKNIILDNDIASLGMHDVVISLHKEVNFKIKVNLSK